MFEKLPNADLTRDGRPRRPCLLNAQMFRVGHAQDALFRLNRGYLTCLLLGVSIIIFVPFDFRLRFHCAYTTINDISGSERDRPEI
ncbi:hypothetical protein BDV30DRAFT_114098 [Aspergillus minisclerotigenes]|uniref:Uncharacterized protein n=1 Tax=Aspergillus minisclerotigenes TaxID=656917 RepID=A0A5N6J4J4_9EURO|nr:hypothetical protein BDV30DRAFT_114098 [Aspergillus minisclerotigenes]